MARDANLENGIRVAQANIAAATTKEEASAKVAEIFATFQRNAANMGWTDDDLAYAFDQMQQAYDAWQPPLVAENDPSQVIVSRTDFDTSNLNVTSQEVAAFEAPGALEAHRKAVFEANAMRRPSMLGKVMVAAGLTAAGLGLVLLAWRTFGGGDQYRAW